MATTHRSAIAADKIAVPVAGDQAAPSATTSTPITTTVRAARRARQPACAARDRRPSARPHRPGFAPRAPAGPRGPRPCPAGTVKILIGRHLAGLRCFDGRRGLNPFSKAPLLLPLDAPKGTVGKLFLRQAVVGYVNRKLVARCREHGPSHSRTTSAVPAGSLALGPRD